MKVFCPLIRRLHLDSTFGLLTARNAILVYEYFKMLDFKNEGGIDDIQFTAFMMTTTDLPILQIYQIFDMLDLDRSGSCEFDEFYLLVCILIAIKDDQAKQFMYVHWRICFELLDENGSKSISKEEFETLGFLFNFSKYAVAKIFSEFDVSGNNELDISEFRLFAFAAIDLERELQRKKNAKKRIVKAQREKQVLSQTRGSTVVLSSNSAPHPDNEV